jgi:putative DNA primase/helicase
MNAPQRFDSLLSAALDYAEHGIPVFPCNPTPEKPNAKRPLTEKGFEDASTDPEQIRTWWKRWPKALIGAPTGARLGAFVLDLDPRKHSAEDMLAGLIAFCDGEILDSPAVRTQSGGLHLWFAWPDDCAPGNRSKLEMARRIWTAG